MPCRHDGRRVWGQKWQQIENLMQINLPMGGFHGYPSNRFLNWLVSIRIGNIGAPPKTAFHTTTHPIPHLTPSDPVITFQCVPLWTWNVAEICTCSPTLTYVLRMYVLEIADKMISLKASKSLESIRAPCCSPLSTTLYGGASAETVTQ